MKRIEDIDSIYIEDYLQFLNKHDLLYPLTIENKKLRNIVISHYEHYLGG
jgi:hypothetical protein